MIRICIRIRNRVRNRVRCNVRNRVRNRIRNARKHRLHIIFLIPLFPTTTTTTTPSLAPFRLLLARLRQLRNLLRSATPRGTVLLPEELRRRLLGQRVVPRQYNLLSNRALAVPPVLIGLLRNRLLVAQVVLHQDLAENGGFRRRELRLLLNAASVGHLLGIVADRPSTETCHVR